MARPHPPKVAGIIDSVPACGEGWTSAPAGGRVAVGVASPEDVIEAKRRLRRAVLARAAEAASARRGAAGRAVCRLLAGLPEVRRAAVVMAFVATAQEVDTWPLIRWAWAEGKQVAVPRIVPAEGGGRVADSPSGPLGGAMEAVLLQPADAASPAEHPALAPDRFGILTAPSAPAVPVQAIDLVLVPCAAVDRLGNRLGKGGGYYDRFLARPEVRAVRIAVAFREQVVDRVPVGPHDVPVDMVVTDAEVLRFRRRG